MANDKLIIELSEAQNYLATYDWSFLRYRLTKVEGWSEKSADRVLEYYRNFLFLQKKYGSEQRIIPSLEIDEAWHAHILYTQEYAQFCDEFFGKFLHHVPQQPGDAGVAAKMAADFDATQELYKQEFGDYIFRVRKKRWWLFG